MLKKVFFACWRCARVGYRCFRGYTHGLPASLSAQHRQSRSLVRILNRGLVLDWTSIHAPAPASSNRFYCS